MKDMYERTGRLLDPHTAVGLGAARELRADPSIPMVCLATAHPAKFPDAVESATGVRPPLPPALARLMELPERYETLPNDLVEVRLLHRRDAGMTLSGLPAAAIPWQPGRPMSTHLHAPHSS